MTKKSTKTSKAVSVTAISNLDNLSTVLSDQAGMELSAIACILREVFIKFSVLEVTSANAKDKLSAKEWKSANSAFNTKRMEAFGATLNDQENRENLAFMDWRINDDGESFVNVAGVYRVADKSDAKGPKYASRYSNRYNSEMTIIRHSIETGDADDIFECLDAKEPDVAAYNIIRAAYNADKKAEKLAEIARKKKDGTTENNPDTTPPKLDENSPQGLRDLYAKADSVKRHGEAAAKYMTDDAWQGFNDKLDEMCSTFQEIIKAAPKADDDDDDATEKAVNS